MIELLQNGSKRSFDLREVQQPTGLGVDLTFAGQFDAEAMAVEPPALVAGRRVRKRVCRLERKAANQTNALSGGITAALTLAFYRIDLLRVRTHV